MGPSSSFVSETARHSYGHRTIFSPIPAFSLSPFYPCRGKVAPFPRHRPRDLTGPSLFPPPISFRLLSPPPPLPPPQTPRETFSFFFLAESAARKIFKASFGRFVSRRTTTTAGTEGVAALSLCSRRPLLARFSFCPVARDDAIIVGTAARRPRKITIIPPWSFVKFGALVKARETAGCW